MIIIYDYYLIELFKTDSTFTIYILFEISIKLLMLNQTRVIKYENFLLLKIYAAYIFFSARTLKMN